VATDSAGAIGKVQSWCPETESNRHVLLGTRDFKSRASASFAIRAMSLTISNLKHLILHKPAGRRALLRPVA
jgi:hypothetical protein